MPGSVALIGAGPGDPGLITVKGLRLLSEAEVVVYDRLVAPSLLRHIRPDAERIYAGKGRDGHTLTQDQINAVLVEKAKEGKKVARLKGGDPFVLGRGGEECEVLRDAGIPYVVVPGISSSIAAPAYAGIPVTHREFAASFTVVSANEDPTKPESTVDWDAIVRTGGTIVALMGWERLPDITASLRKAGMPESTPAALVHRGTQPSQRTVTGTLGDIVKRGRAARLTPPVVAVFGGVASLAERLRWFETRPLFGKRVLVTRTREQASALSALLSEQGAQPVEVPTIEVRPTDDFAPLDAALSRLDTFGWAVFTSANAVDAVFERMDALGRDARAFSRTRVCAVGPATAAALRAHGLRADLVPTRFTTEALIPALGDAGIRGQRVLLPRTDIAPPELTAGLRNAGAEAVEVVAYRTVTPDAAAEEARQALAEGIDIATFTASSTVKNLAALLGGDLSGLAGVTIASIGPATSAACREVGLRVDVEATEHTIPGLVASLVEHLAATDAEPS